MDYKENLKKITEESILIGDQAKKEYKETSDFQKGWLAVRSYRTAIKAMVVSKSFND